MKKYRIMLVLIVGVALSFAGCKKDNPDDQFIDQVRVAFSDVPYKTEVFLRIPYTLEFWEWEKDGLVLEKITVLDKKTGDELMSIEKDGLPRIHKDPLPVNPYFTFDKITHAYFSLQLAIPLEQQAPQTVIHHFIFQDSVKNAKVEFEGAELAPRLNELPLVIASPVKGKNWVFINQSSNDYHFNTLFFLQGSIFRPERFAFDNLRMSDDLTQYFEGDPKKNESYFNYRDTLFAIAGGTVVAIQDGRPENHGDAQDVTFNTTLDLAGNFLILDIGGGRFAYYCHCVPNSFMVKENDLVNEGDPIALLGNSGNSTAPHLHFQICDGPEFFGSNGVPFVLKKYTKTGDVSDVPFKVTPKLVTNSMMEQFSVIGFE